MLAQKRHTTHWNDKRCIRDTSPDQHSAGLRKHDQTKKIQLRRSATTTRPRQSSSNRESKHPTEITRNRIVTPRRSHRNGERQKKRKRPEKRFRSCALTTPRFANGVPSSPCLRTTGRLHDKHQRRCNNTMGAVHPSPGRASVLHRRATPPGRILPS